MQSSTDPVLVSEFHPCEKNIIVTCGKGQISFWTLEGSTLTRKQGIFEVKFLHKPRGVIKYYTYLVLTLAFSGLSSYWL